MVRNFILLRACQEAVYYNKNGQLIYLTRCFGFTKVFCVHFCNTIHDKRCWVFYRNKEDSFHDVIALLLCNIPCLWHILYLSRVIRKQFLAYAKTKVQISSAVTSAVQIVQTICFLNLEVQASIHLLWFVQSGLCGTWWDTSSTGFVVTGLICRYSIHRE